MYDIVVIGAGTAGLTAAIYSVRAGKKVLVLEGKAYGGQIINTPSIENYPGIKNVSGFEFATNLYEQAIELGVEVKYEKVISIEDLEQISNKVVKVESGEEYKCKAIIIATGTVNRKLGLDKEEELIGKGISYCATCDGAFYRGKDVAVVGGGSTALEDGIFLSNYCNKVYVVHRRDAFRGEEALVKALEEKDNVEFILDSNVVNIQGDAQLEALDIKNNKTGKIIELKLNGLFIAIGQVPSNDLFSKIIELDSYGYIVADETCKTSVEGVYVAGDCRTKKVRQLTTAAADGAVSALAACEYIDAK
ncbi:MAG: thioredoxin-disulfide reductase [Lachnospiraceae bacterium]|nr:thioredoxin-disulfide reductase [Lachnospiraceae bacterium]